MTSRSVTSTRVHQSTWISRPYAITHPSFVTGVLAMLAQRLVLPLGRTDTWTRLSAWFVPFYQ